MKKPEWIRSVGICWTCTRSIVFFNELHERARVKRQRESSKSMSDGFDAPAAHLEMMYCIEQITFKNFLVLLVIDFNVLSLSAVCIRSQKKCWCMKMNLNGGLSENIEGISRAIRRSRCEPRKLKSHKAVQVEFGNESNIHHFRLLNMHSPQQFNTKVKKRKHRKKFEANFNVHIDLNE